MPHTLNDLYPHIISKIGSCPKPLAMMELGEAYEEFCDRSEAWITTVKAITLVANQSDYPMAIKYDARIKRIVNAWFIPSWNYDPIPNTHYDLVDEQTFQFRPPNTPNSGQVTATPTMDVELCIVPRLETLEMDDNLFERWATRAIMQRALVGILGMKKRDWYDSDEATKAQLKYDTALAEARANKERRNKGGDMRVIPRRWV